MAIELTQAGKLVIDMWVDEVASDPVQHVIPGWYMLAERTVWAGERTIAIKMSARLTRTGDDAVLQLAPRYFKES